MAEWKDTYESYLSHWHAESAEARKKAEETRQRIEREREAEKKAEEEKKKAEKAAIKAKERREKEEKLVKEKAEKDALKLKEVLEGKQAATSTSAKAADSHRGEREKKVKEAWELVKSAGEGESRDEVTTDARGVLPEDVAAGQALPKGQHRPPVQQAS